MKFVNLDQFRAVTKVTISGVEYEIYGLTVADYLGRDALEDVNKATTREEQIIAIMEILRRMTNIPEEVLLAQPFHILTALLLVSQGVEPTEEAIFGKGTAEGAQPEKK